MNRRVALLFAFLLGSLVVVAGASLTRAWLDRPAPAAALVALVDDCTLPDGPGACDGGPVTGTIAHRMDETGALIIEITLDNARTSSEYPVLLNDCGSTDVLTCATIMVGLVTTDAQGHGSLAVAVSKETLRAAPFGRPGPHTGRVSLTKPGAVGRHGRPGVLTAAGIDYTIQT